MTPQRLHASAEDTYSELALVVVNGEEIVWLAERLEVTDSDVGLSRPAAEEGSEG